jgi:formate transporter
MSAPDPLHDAYSPPQIAERVHAVGTTKANADALTILVLAVLAGAFISLGAMFFIVATTGNPDLGFGLNRVIGGTCFSLGLVLVVVGGAELFTGNNLMAMAWASGSISTRQLLRHWALAYLGNVVGCLLTVLLVRGAGLNQLHQGAVQITAVNIAVAKINLSSGEVFCRGVLCNALVCLAVWLAMGGRSVMDKILAIVLPITAFVTMGLEHSIANWFFLPLGALWTTGHIPNDWIVANLVMSTLGNLVGGTLLVAAVYWLAYLRTDRDVARHS